MIPFRFYKIEESLREDIAIFQMEHVDRGTRQRVWPLVIPMRDAINDTIARKINDLV